MEEIVAYLREHSWIVEVFVIVFVTAVARYVAKLLFNRLATQLAKTHNLYDDAFLEAARKPLGVSIWVLGISWAADAVGGAARAEIFDYVSNIREVAEFGYLFGLRRDSSGS